MYSTHRIETNFLDPLALPGGSAIKDTQSSDLKSKIEPFNRELCSIEGCQPHIYAELTFDAKSPLAQRELLYEVPSLRVTLKVKHPFLREQSDFAFFEVLNPSEIALFREISSSDVPRV